MTDLLEGQILTWRSDIFFQKVIYTVGQKQEFYRSDCTQCDWILLNKSGVVWHLEKLLLSWIGMIRYWKKNGGDEHTQYKSMRVSYTKLWFSRNTLLFWNFFALLFEQVINFTRYYYKQWQHLLKHVNFIRMNGTLNWQGRNTTLLTLAVTWKGVTCCNSFEFSCTVFSIIAKDKKRAVLCSDALFLSKQVNSLSL